LQVLADQGDGPLLLLGDFNEWRPPSRPLRRLHRHFGRTPGLRSFPSNFPLLALDRIWMQPRSALIALEVHTSRWARVASDHLPVRAVIAPPAASSARRDEARRSAAS
jgi:endonuclease/exonuclease/phosphatase family metal-dependent hydrolase